MRRRKVVSLTLRNARMPSTDPASSAGRLQARSNRTSLDRSRRISISASKPAENQDQALLPLDVSSQRPQIRRLHADAAGHHQRDRLDRRQHMQQNAAGHGRKGETGKPRNKRSCKHGSARETIRRRAYAVTPPARPERAAINRSEGFPINRRTRGSPAVAQRIRKAGAAGSRRPECAASGIRSRWLQAASFHSAHPLRRTICRATALHLPTWPTLSIADFNSPASCCWVRAWARAIRCWCCRRTRSACRRRDRCKAANSAANSPLRFDGRLATTVVGENPVTW